ncbi:MAG: hypothetical protein Q7S09_05355 [bacterium]|nr:hypothetical protein [bacterium]
MDSSRGTFIVFHGINNLGKSTQATLLVERILREGGRAMYLKYPCYDLEPSGPLLNEYLRKKNPYGLTPREAQMLFALNRTQFEPILSQEYLARGITVVAEDYTCTGIAWGVGAGVDRAFLTRVNCHLLREDVSFLFDGKRFADAKEQGHAHEMDDDLTERVRLVHTELAKEFGWHVVDANESREAIHEQIWNITQPLLS